MHDARKELNALLLTSLGRIQIQAPFVPLESPRDIVRTTHTPTTRQTRDFEAEKAGGTVLFSVRAAPNGNGSAGAASRTAVRTIVLALPETVLGQITAQGLPTCVPLTAGHTQGCSATQQGLGTGHSKHGLVVARSLVRVRIRTEKKDTGKGQWRRKAPNVVRQAFTERRRRLEDVGAASKAAVQAAAFFPAVAAVVVDGVRHKVRDHHAGAAAEHGGALFVV